MRTIKTVRQSGVMLMPGSDEPVSVRIVRESDWRKIMRFLRAWDRANGYTGRSYVEGAMRWEDVEEAWAALNKKEVGR